MHADIKKFWEDAGYMVTSMGPSIEDCVIAYNKNGDYHIIMSVFNKVSVYSWGHNWYTEKQMLKIVAMKAFL